MRLTSLAPRTAAATCVLLYSFFLSQAQSPPSIQFFMPDGSLPQRELRFMLTSTDGRVVDTYYTDSKGRFLVTRSSGLRPENGFTITVQSDGRTFDTTTYLHRSHGLSTIYYIPIFLNRLETKAAPPAGVIDLAELDVLAPQQARDEYEGAMRAIKSGQMNEAVVHLKQAIEIYPKYFRALNDLGVVLMKLKRLDEASQAFARAIEVAPRVYYPRLNLAIIKTRQAHYTEAIEILEKLHNDYPALTEARTPLADALMAANRLDEAEPHLRAALADDKLDDAAIGNTRYLLGLLFNRKQRFNEAIKELDLASKLLPEAPRIHLQLGGALLQVKRFDDAERELLAAYRFGGKEMGAAQFLLGELYFRQKRFANAMAAFEKYLADVPQAPNASEVQGVINKIRAALNQK